MTSQLGRHHCDVITMTMTSLVTKRHLSFDVIRTLSLRRHLSSLRHLHYDTHYDVIKVESGQIKVGSGQGWVRTSRSGRGQVGSRKSIFDQNYVLIKTYFDQDFDLWPWSNFDLLTAVKPLPTDHSQTLTYWLRSNVLTKTMFWSKHLLTKILTYWPRSIFDLLTAVKRWPTGHGQTLTYRLQSNVLTKTMFWSKHFLTKTLTYWPQSNFDLLTAVKYLWPNYVPDWEHLPATIDLTGDWATPVHRADLPTAR